MENLLICLNAVLPIFLTLAVGYAACHFGIIARENVAMINKVAFKIFMPVLSFENICRSDLSASIRPGLLLYALASTLIVFGVSWFVINRTEKDISRRGVLIQAIFRSNFVILGIPLAKNLLGNVDIGAVAFLSAIIVPLYNVMAVVILAIYDGQKPNAKAIIRQIITNPIIVGTVAGIIVAALKLELPTALNTVVSNLANVASPLMLVLLGAFFRFDGLLTNLKALSLVCLFKLVIIPGIVLGLAVPLGFRGVEFVALIGMIASPVAVSSFTMAQQMGGDAELAGGCVVSTSVLCSFTIFLWSLLFKSMGIF